MRAPMAVAVVKSNGVPFTGFSSPVGMSPSSTGVKRSAAIITSWPRMSPSPARLKYVWFVALAVFELLIVLVDARADGRGGGEVEWRALHRLQLAGGNEPIVDRREAVGGDHHLVAEDVALAGKIEIRVVRE